MIALASSVGFFVGASVNDSMGGAIVFSMIAGIVCVVYTLDSREEQSVFAELQTGHGCLSVSRALLFFLVFAKVGTIPSVVLLVVPLAPLLYPRFYFLSTAPAIRAGDFLCLFGKPVFEW